MTERTSIPTSGKAPPGPRDLPVFGSLFSLRNDPHMAIHRFARQYGDVCCLQLDSVPTVAISHPELLKEAFDKTELSASSASEIMDIGAHHGKDLALAPYGEHWRQLQCFANRELLSSRQLQQIREQHVEEAVNSLVEDVGAKSDSGQLVEHIDMLSRSNATIMFRPIFDRSYNDTAEFEERRED